MNSRWSPDSSTNETTAERSSRVGRERREARVVEAHRDLRREVLEQVAGQPELREDDEPGALRASLADELVMEGEVLVEHAETGGDLGEGDAELRHARRIAVRGS